MLTEVTATRYVTPLREGGSLPGIVEADDDGTYVAKFHGAGQGRKALIAEIISGELARRLDLPVPDLALITIDPLIARAEPDEEVQELLKASAGRNLAMDFLPRALGYDPLTHGIDPRLAGRILFFDAFVGNVDRSWRNPNMLLWHREPYLIDHGATLIFHHNWARTPAPTKPYDASDHVMAHAHPDLAAADTDLAPRLTPALLTEAIDLVPDEWLTDEPGFTGPQHVRDAYLNHLSARAADRSWLPEVTP
ncbi:hypothetical protein CLV63_116176 [Murinocardiopsis flavida]|uniref:HipA-like kinase domain-containing protein n=1 Tax=Murinocardiopsis flavida TaxID=645275 RepID=A0A2P8D980_9ACTN|nr:HipA family kinase [Murinocardiopsis flavida]PSK93769.1 hypothetical protein CLV63_116176 [Murinocardiopsis flavida]